MGVTLAFGRVGWPLSNSPCVSQKETKTRFNSPPEVIEVRSDQSLNIRMRTFGS